MFGFLVPRVHVVAGSWKFFHISSYRAGYKVETEDWKLASLPIVPFDLMPQPRGEANLMILDEIRSSAKRTFCRQLPPSTPGAYRGSLSPVPLSWFTTAPSSCCSLRMRESHGTNAATTWSQHDGPWHPPLAPWMGPFVAGIDGATHYGSFFSVCPLIGPGDDWGRADVGWDGSPSCPQTS